MESLKSGKKFEPKKECYVTLIINVKEEESRKVIEKKCPEKKNKFWDIVSWDTSFMGARNECILRDGMRHNLTVLYAIRRQIPNLKVCLSLAVGCTWTFLRTFSTLIVELEAIYTSVDWKQMKIGM